ncbi:MAG TPA: hypothetical protein PLL78_01515 [Fimbriimonadaceae bacterium]|nr:hypothetical protein [Fimbriimonadaceae bacterium]HRJ95337.1 hypothetical protein [Fimbriimonadaceae bacterium]
MPRKTWEEKYAARTEPEIVVLPKPFGGGKAGDRMVISSPAAVEAELRRIPPGTVIDLSEFRRRLARSHQADLCCPTSTSIFLRIVAEVVLEKMSEGADDDTVAPFWRAVNPESPLAGRLSCGLNGSRRSESRNGKRSPSQDRL